MASVHGLVGLVALAVVVVAGLHARSRVRSGRPFEGGPYRLAAVAVDVAVAVGLWLWVDGEWWDAREQPVRAWVHPALAVMALVVAHVGTRRARGERWAAEAYAIAGRALLLAGLLLAAAGALALRT